MSQDKPHFEDAFREALKNHETAVSPKVWAGVQSSIATTTAATSGSAILGKAAAVIGFSALITAATISEVQHANTGAETVSDAKEIEMSVATTTENNATEKVAAFSETEKTIADDINKAVVSSDTKQNLKADPSTEIEIAETTAIESVEESLSSSIEQSSIENENTVENAAAQHAVQIKNTAEAEELTNEEEAPKVVVSKEEEDPEEPKTTAYFTHSAETIFTPNGDGFHDHFEVEGFGVKSFQIRIMNRGGQVIFESNDLKFQWNGNDRFGQPAPEGVYFYAIQAIGQDGLPYLEKNSKGSVTLKR